MLVGAVVGGTAIYLFGTDSGKKEFKRLKKTGSATANIFKIVGEEVSRNLKQEWKEERTQALKDFVREAAAV